MPSLSLAQAQSLTDMAVETRDALIQGDFADAVAMALEIQRSAETTEAAWEEIESRYESRILDLEGRIEVLKVRLEEARLTIFALSGGVLPVVIPVARR